MKSTFTAIFLATGLGALAQTQPIGNASASLDVTNVKPTLRTGGDLFTQANGPGYEVPRGSGKHTIYAGGLWLGGLSSAGQLYVSQQTYRQSGSVGFWPGPVGNTQGPAHNTKYDKIWKVSKTQIQQHILNYNTAGYTMPADIATWPGNGNAANAEAAQLAPYVDVNNDGIYSPLQGDYPAIKGDQALFYILNDKGNVKGPASPAMGVEVHIMVYGYNTAANQPVNNTVFSEYKFVNRSQTNYHQVYAGLWMDFDLGHFNDDYVGCDTLTNRFYVYNADSDDEGPDGYGLTPPVQSIMFLNQPMGHFLYYENSNHAVKGNPATPQHFYNYLSGRWKDNSPVTYGEDGTNQSKAPFAYMFPGDPVTQLGWSERNRLDSPVPIINPAADRRGVGSMGPFSLSAGQEFTITSASVFSQGTSNLNSLTVAQQDAQAVQNFYTNTILAVSDHVAPERTLSLLPNPASTNVTVQLPAEFRKIETTVTVTDNLGREVLKLKPGAVSSEGITINIGSLKKGIYQVVVSSGNRVATNRLVKL